MGIFGRRKDDFEFDAYETDKSTTRNIFLITLGILFVLGILIYVGYTQYQRFTGNSTILNITGGNISPTNPGEIEVVFDEDFNVTVKENPQGIYYYTTYR